MTTNHLQKKYLSYIQGPILFTAPHSKKLYRGGKGYDQKLRIHLRQIYTSYLAVYLARETRLNKKDTNSFCVWGKSAQMDQGDLDPNYLVPENMDKSPFHKILHKWAQHHLNMSKGESPPLLHIDIHGKMDREKNCEVDVGLKSMKYYWKSDHPLLQMFNQYFQKQFNKIFQGKQFGKFKCSFNCDPILHGFWGCEIKTMTEQAIMLNIPSFQLQIPRKVRVCLFKEQQFRKEFAKGIVVMYNQILSPWWHKSLNSNKLCINKELAQDVQVTLANDKQTQQLEKQLQIMDQKAALLLNVKFI